MAIRRAAKNLMLVRRIQKRTADKYLQNPADLNSIKVVAEKMDQGLLAQEGFEVFARRTSNDNEYRGNDGHIYYIDARGEVNRATPVQPAAPAPVQQYEAVEETLSTGDSLNAKLEQMERSELKTMADQMGLTYAKNISTARLIKLIANA